MVKVVVLFLTCVCSLPVRARGEDIKRAVFAGQFYDRNPAVLAASVDGYLTEARPLSEIPGRILAVISPHAGYVYSGRTAGHAYALVRDAAYDTVIILGPSHRVGFHGCSIYLRGGFETPLGVVPIDEDLAGAVAKATGFGFNAAAFAEEHSIEVQIPFIQRALPRAKIVPILMGYQTRKTIRTLAEGLSRSCSGEKVLIVASTDMSHFLTRKEAQAIDSGTASLIRGFKSEVLIRKVEAGENIMCGGGPVVAALLYAEKAGTAKAEILKTSDSGSFSGEENVVGYLAAVLYSEDEGTAAEFTLSRAEKTDLLNLARAAITTFVSDRRLPEYTTDRPRLLANGAAFVTLRKKNALRGCIGFIEAAAPLYQTVVQAAVYAAVEDGRFPPVEAKELPSIAIEISVLTPLREIMNPQLVQVGRHGLVIERGGRRGLLLPQVPVENGWDRETFLDQACLKAGLPSDAWRKGAKISVFEAIVFHE